MRKLYVLLFLAFSLMNFSLLSQNQIFIEASDSIVCGGDSISMSVRMPGKTETFSWDFNNGTTGSFMALSNYIISNNTCGNGPFHNYIWMNSPLNQSRELQSPDFDIVNATEVTLSFWLKYGKEQQAGSCEAPDGQNDGVRLQYSHDQGQTWKNFEGPNIEPTGKNADSLAFFTSVPGSGTYWEPHPTLSSQLNSELYYWNYYRCSFPDSAFAISTRFRFAQLQFSGDGYDTWGMDQIELFINRTGYQQDDFTWSGNKTGMKDIWFSFPQKGFSYDTLITVSTYDHQLTDTIRLTVVPPPDATFTSPSDTICRKQPVQFINTPISDPWAIYNWEINGNPVAETSGWLDYTFYLKGDYEIKLTVDHGSCQDVYTDTIYAGDVFMMPAYSVSPRKSCGSTQVAFHIDSSAFYTEWQITPQIYSNQNSISYIYTSPGIYHPKLLVIDSVSGCQADILFNILIGEEPVADFSPDLAYPQFGDVYFTDESIINDTIQYITSWKWYFGDGDSSSVQNPWHYYPGGSYNPVLKITTNLGCSSSDTGVVYVSGIDETQREKVDIYPNPAGNFIIIEAEEQLPESYRIYDITGRLIKSMQLSNGVNKHKINVSNLSSGSYLLEMDIKNKPVRMKFIKS